LISGTITAAMEALLIGPTLALSFAATMLVGKALLRALLKAMERTTKSAKQQG
jgi:broad specificity polyphosphatase/5'/3'-nucleotidase SurE